jgi:hypothetical protein
MILLCFNSIENAGDLTRDDFKGGVASRTIVDIRYFPLQRGIVSIEGRRLRAAS